MIDIGELDNSIQSFDGKLETSFRIFLNDQKSFGKALQKIFAYFTDQGLREPLINNGMARVPVRAILHTNISILTKNFLNLPKTIKRCNKGLIIIKTKRTDI